MLLTHNIYKNCLDSLKIPPEERKNDHIEDMLPYINTLTSFTNSLKQANLKNYNVTLREICQNMTLQSIQKDRFVVKYGEKGNVFYIILNGSVSIIVVKNRKGYLNEEEYIDHLLQLRKNKESELLRMTISLNNMVFHIDDSFDNWIKSQVHKKDSHFSKDLISQMKTTLEYIKYNIDCFQDGVTNEKYLRFINPPELYETGEKNRKAVTIPFYDLINIFSTGQSFGYFALENANQKRQATLITMEDCDFGIISKEVYNRLLKSVNEIIRKKFYQTVYYLPLFQGIARANFENYYYNFFEYKIIAKGIFLLKENEISTHIYVVNSGEYEISMRGNVMDINNTLIFLKDLAKMRKKRKKFIEEEENDELNLVGRYKTQLYMDAINKKNEIKLGIIKSKDVIGLNDLVNIKNNIANFTVKCLTHDSDVYSINRKLYKRMYLGYEGEELVQTKLPFLIERLETFKQSIFDNIERNERELRKDNRHLFIKIKKQDNDFNLLKSVKNNNKIIEMIKGTHLRTISDSETFITTHTVSNNILSLKDKFKIQNKSQNNGIIKKEEKIQNLKLPLISSGILPKKNITKILNKGLYNTIFRTYSNIDREIEKNNFNSISNSNDDSNNTIIPKNGLNTSRHLIYSINYSSPKGKVGVFDPLIMDKFNFCYRKAIRNLVKEYKKKK